MALWRDTTQKQYAVHLQKWQLYCCKKQVDMFSPAVADFLDFLPTELYETNSRYSTLNSARSALSTNTVEEINGTMSNLEDWSTKSNLLLNSSKTKQMLITTQQMSTAHGLKDLPWYLMLQSREKCLKELLHLSFWEYGSMNISNGLITLNTYLLRAMQCYPLFEN